MSRLNINNLTNENEDGSPKISGISTFSSTHYFVPPSGSTAERPSHADPGMIRFNTDSGHLEYYNGVEWTSVIVNNNELGISNNAAGTSGGLGARGVFAGGYIPAGTGNRATIDYITISTLGNAISFGSLASARRGFDGCGSETRGVMSGGDGVNNGGNSRIQDFITYASTGNATSFGNLDFGREGGKCCSSSTRGMHCGGGSPFTNVMNYFTIAATGSSQDFGDLTFTNSSASSLSSPVRGIFQGNGPSPGGSGSRNNIDFWTISTTGNATSFGELSGDYYSLAAAGNSIRGIFGSIENPSATNTLEFITISSTGNGQDFGDLDVPYNAANAVSSPTRYVVGSGQSPSNPNNLMSYVTIATTGNGINFGDLTEARFNPAACSNGHGGL